MKEQKGITLVALIITIIVMLILVAVSVSVVIQSNVLGSAKNAAQQTKNAVNVESGNIPVTVKEGENNVDASSIENYVNSLMNPSAE